jgi:hypothetical protein
MKEMILFSSIKSRLKDISRDGSIIDINNIAYFILMSINRNKRDLLKRDQALNDLTSGQLGDEPRSKPSPAELFEPNTDDSIRDSQVELLEKSPEIFNCVYQKGFL